jgi:hypothetical protein
MWLLDPRDILVDPDDDESGLAGLQLFGHLLGVLARHAVRKVAYPRTGTAIPAGGNSSEPNCAHPGVSATGRRRPRSDARCRAG